MHNASLGLVDHLLAEWPAACKEIQDPSNDHVGPTAKPNYCWLPLHVACMSKAHVSVVRRLLEVYPEACEWADTLAGELPLHHSLVRGADEAVIDLLLDAYPKAAEKVRRRSRPQKGRNEGRRRVQPPRARRA